MSSNLYTLSEAAGLGYGSRQTLSKAFNEGRLSGRRFGRVVVVSRDDLDRFRPGPPIGSVSIGPLELSKCYRLTGASGSVIEGRAIEAPEEDRRKAESELAEFIKGGATASRMPPGMPLGRHVRFSMKDERAAAEFVNEYSYFTFASDSRVVGLNMSYAGILYVPSRQGTRVVIQ